ncbi:PAS domain-containing sensor histidine kinase [Pontibacter chitinilyticus]|uniref:PAS domain-containing sensor histidine kinase n=1 Tax=Pontibacter chitinilyticus TaxID=2674989 RepID=UPI00321A4CC1
MQQVEDKTPGQDVLSFFQGGGEMGTLMRAFDWDNHPIGNPSLWPESLRTNVRLLLNSGFPMFIWWSQDLYMFHNDAYLPALGNKHPEALGASARVMWAEIWKDLGVVVDNILKGGNPFYAEALKLMLERKGFPEETYWTFSYSPVFDDQGKVNGIFCACHEVTGRVINARRLKSLKDVSEIMPFVQALEQAGQQTCDILFENKGDIPFCMIYLLNGTATAATLIGKAGNIAPSSSPAVIDLVKQDSSWPIASVRASRQATLLNCSHLNIVSVTDEDLPNQVKQAVILPVMRPGQNQVIGFLIAGISPQLEYNEDYKGFHALLEGQIAITITSVQAREELARQQEYLKEIFQQAPVGITIIRGPKHIIDLANPGVCEIWGRKPEDVLGKPVVEALPEVVDQGIIQLLDNVVNTGQPFIANELPLMLERNGELETVFLNFIYHPLRDAQGCINGVIAVAIDISQQVKFRQSVEALNDELLATNSDLDNFVYSASHDLKAPVSNIEGLMRALVEDLPKDVLQTGSVKKILTLIQASVDRFKQAVSDLAEVAKIQRQGEDDISFIHLADVVAEVLLDFDLQIAGAWIETEVPADVVIQFSAKNVRSIVYNLISNALKYRSPDRELCIRITAEQTPDQVIFTVQDNGLGLNPAEKNKIFTMFKRLHDHVEGTGVGLYIVKRIIENAGGSIEVESNIGTGSTFRVSFKR